MANSWPSNPYASIAAALPNLTAAFVTLVFGCAALAVALVHAALAVHERRAAAARAASLLGVLAACEAALAVAGASRSFGPVPVAGLLLAPLAIANVWFALCSLSGGRLAGGAPLWMLVGFQGARLAVEVFLHAGHAAGIVPPQLLFPAWGGRNVDALAALAAIALGWWALERERAGRPAPPAPWLWAFGLLGLCSLLNVAYLAAASMPTRFRSFPDDDAALLRAPFIWLPGGLVQLALCGQLLLLRRLAVHGAAGRRLVSSVISSLEERAAPAGSPPKPGGGSAPRDDYSKWGAPSHMNSKVPTMS